MANPAQFLRLYFNLSYYLCIFPFRFQLCPETCKFVIVRSRFQTAIWLLVCILTTSSGVKYAVEEYDLQRRREINTTPGDLYFRRVNLLTDGFLFMIIFFSQITGADKFLKVINTLHESKSYDNPHKNQFKIFWIPTLFVLLISMSVPMVLVYFSATSWDFDAGVTLLGNHGIQQVFLSKIIQPSEILTPFFAVLRFLSILSYYFYMACGELLLLTSCFVVNDCLNHFMCVVRNEEVDGLETYKEFVSLKKIMTLLNRALGPLIFGIVFGLLPYFVVTFASFVNPDNAWDFTINIIEFSIVYWFLGFAANIGRKANLIMDRFIHMKDLSKLSLFQTNSILHDISSHFVEFSCAGFCNISPGFVGGMIQLLLTFSVILIQFQMPN